VFGDTVSMNMVCIHKSIPQNIDGLRSVELDRPSC
jgi:hypothetical protein